MAKNPYNKPIKTPKGSLQYIFIKDKGRNSAVAGQPERMQFMASIKFHKDDPSFKEFEKELQEIWKGYMTGTGCKTPPSTNGIKPIMEATDEVDDYGAAIKKDTGYRLITFKTDITFPDGKPKEIKVFQPSGADITEVMKAQPWSIGNDTEGIIHGVASPNNVADKQKITLYLDAVQLAGKLEKYTGTTVEVDVIEEAEDIALDIVIDTEMSEEETPNL